MLDYIMRTIFTGFLVKNNYLLTILLQYSLNTELKTRLQQDRSIWVKAKIIFALRELALASIFLSNKTRVDISDHAYTCTSSIDLQKIIITVTFIFILHNYILLLLF